MDRIESNAVHDHEVLPVLPRVLCVRGVLGRKTASEGTSTEIGVGKIVKDERIVAYLARSFLRVSVAISEREAHAGSRLVVIPQLVHQRKVVRDGTWLCPDTKLILSKTSFQKIRSEHLEKVLFPRQFNLTARVGVVVIVGDAATFDHLLCSVGLSNSFLEKRNGHLGSMLRRQVECVRGEPKYGIRGLEDLHGPESHLWTRANHHGHKHILRGDPGAKQGHCGPAGVEGSLTTRLEDACQLGFHLDDEQRDIISVATICRVCEITGTVPIGTAIACSVVSVPTGLGCDISFEKLFKEFCTHLLVV
eukprot:comp24186_c0_seq1/m.59937 comp24186_c0_seq1/g.59937  ORF comp24186_c0_seq1/g.59937 comp24186_c0_seq1/m.59937 type:complete len:306 (-) comp24186_c0_seq1:230-1147(-)